MHRRGRVSHVNRQSLEPFSLTTNQLCIAQTIRIRLYTRLDYSAVETSADGLYGSSSARGGFIWLSPASWALTLSLSRSLFPSFGPMVYSFGSIYTVTYSICCPSSLFAMCYYQPAATGRQQLFDQLGERKRNERFQDGQPPFKAELPREIVLIFLFLFFCFYFFVLFWVGCLFCCVLCLFKLLLPFYCPYNSEEGWEGHQFSLVVTPVIHFSV